MRRTIYIVMGTYDEETFAVKAYFNKATAIRTAEKLTVKAKASRATRGRLFYSWDRATLEFPNRPL